MTALPKLQKPVHFITLPVSKEKIKFQPFLVAEEKSLLTSLDPKKKDEAVKIFKDLIDQCVLEENFDVSKLNIVDFYFLVLNIRMKSTGEIIDGSLPCKHCKKNTTFEINLEESIKIQNPDVSKVMVDINDNLSIRVVPSNINTLFEKEEVNVLDLVAGSIDICVIDKKIYKDFTQQELKTNILSTLTKMDFDEISKGLQKLVRLYVEFTFNCINCGKSNTHKTDNIASI